MGSKSQRLDIQPLSFPILRIVQIPPQPISSLIQIWNSWYLDINVYLRAWVQISQHRCLESLLEVKAHLCGLAIPMGSSLPLRCTEGRHAVLAVDDSTVMEGLAAGASHLENREHLILNKLLSNPLTAVSLILQWDSQSLHWWQQWYTLTFSWTIGGKCSLPVYTTISAKRSGP